MANVRILEAIESDQIQAWVFVQVQIIDEVRRIKPAEPKTQGRTLHGLCLWLSSGWRCGTRS